VIAWVVTVPVGVVALFFLFGAANTMLPASF
jgi:hypothetical protein